MINEHSAGETTMRVGALCQATVEALRHGLVAATSIHAQRGWNPDADPHCFHHLVRREALERLRAFGPREEDDQNLGLPMSGLIIDAGEDIIRVWHTPDGTIPVPNTGSARAYVSQASMHDSLFPDLEISLNRNRLVLLWTAAGQDLAFCQLVRPNGILRSPRRVASDWCVDLLNVGQRMADVGYRRRGEVGRSAAFEGTAESDVRG